MKRPPPELNPLGMDRLLVQVLPLSKIELKIAIFVMDVLRPAPYLAGLLNRMDIKAIVAAPSFAMRTRNHEAWETPRHHSGAA